MVKYFIYLLTILLCIGSVIGGTVTDTDSSGISFISSVGLTYNSYDICREGYTTSYDLAGSNISNVSKLNGRRYSTGFTSSNDEDVYVCSSGCDYTTLQDAVDDTPFFLYATRRIHISDGTYNENIYIKPVICGRTTESEGSIVCLRILGNSSNINGVKVSSFQIASAIGANTVEIQDMEIFGREPNSDENTSVSLYGGCVQLKNINFTGNVDYGVLSYSGDLHVRNSYFNNQTHLGQSKGIGSTLRIGDTYGSAGNTGYVKEELIKADDASYVFLENNSVTYNGNLAEPKGNGIVIVSQSDEDLTPTYYYNLEGVLQNFEVFGNLTAEKIFSSNGLRFNTFGSSNSVIDSVGAVYVNAGYDLSGNEDIFLQSNGNNIMRLDSDLNTYIYNNLSIDGSNIAINDGLGASGDTYINFNDNRASVGFGSSVAYLQAGTSRDVEIRVNGGTPAMRFDNTKKITIYNLTATYTNNSAFVCVNNTGVIYASEVACP